LEYNGVYGIYQISYKLTWGDWPTALQAFEFLTSLYRLDIGYCKVKSRDCM